MLRSYYFTARKKINKRTDIYLSNKKSDINVGNTIIPLNIDNFLSEESSQRIIIIYMPIRNDKKTIQLQTPIKIPHNFSTKNPRTIKLSIKSKKFDWDFIKKYLDSDKIL
jgi:hypothetical protein